METKRVSHFTVAAAVGWGEILKRTGQAVYAGNCLDWAAELAYFWFLGLFPALLFLVALTSYIPAQRLIETIVGTLGRFAPGDVIAIVRTQLLQITREPHSGLLTLSLLGALWSSSAGMTALISTLNWTYHVQDRRPWWRVRTLAIALSVALAGFWLASLALLIVGPTLAERVATSLGLGPAFTWTWTIAQWPVIFGLLVTALGWIYYFAPDVQQQWIWLTPGSIVATVLWMGASLGFKWYASHFGDYQKTYGVIGGVIAALLWLYASGLAILIGAELNATIARAAGDGTP
jgi:membrane protein